MTKDQPFVYFWMGSSFNVGGAGCPGQNTLEGFSLEVSVVGETDHPTKLLVKKHQGEILCSIFQTDGSS